MVNPTYWLRQTKATPLFPDLLWSRPENRRHAGKLLIVGGSGYEFKEPANAYGDALDAGIGSATVLLPGSMKKTVADIFPEAEFAPSTPSGSLARHSLDTLLQLAGWADGVLLAGNLGRNSETAILLESFLQRYDGQVTVTGDAVEYCLATPDGCLQRANTTLVLEFAQLQKLATQAKFATAFTSTMGLLQLVEALHDLAATRQCNLLVQHTGQACVAAKGQVSTTPQPDDQRDWPTHTATHAAVWWLQNPAKPFESLVTSLVAD